MTDQLKSDRKASPRGLIFSPGSRGRYTNQGISRTAVIHMNDDDPAERELAIFMDVILLGKCSELWVLGDTVSAGMQAEIDVAKKRRQPIRYFNSKFQEVELL